ncbi:uncharacterized protein PS065_013041 isoform 1-T1 [Dugong dugon]
MQSPQNENSDEHPDTIESETSELEQDLAHSPTKWWLELHESDRRQELHALLKEIHAIRQELSEIWQELVSSSWSADLSEPKKCCAAHRTEGISSNVKTVCSCPGPGRLGPARSLWPQVKASDSHSTGLCPPANLR